MVKYGRSNATCENSSVTGSNGLIGMNDSSLVFFIIGLHDFTGVITVIGFADNLGGGNVSGVLFLLYLGNVTGVHVHRDPWHSPTSRSVQGGESAKLHTLGLAPREAPRAAGPTMAATSRPLHSGGWWSRSSPPSWIELHNGGQRLSPTSPGAGLELDISRAGPRRRSRSR